MNYVVHDNNLDIFIRSIPITLMSEGFMRLSQKKTCDPNLKGQMIVFCEYDSKPNIDKSIFHERVKIGEYYAFLINPGVTMTFNNQDYLMLSKPFLPCSSISMKNMEQYLANLEETHLESKIYQALMKDAAQGASAQTLLKSLLNHTSEEFKSLLDDMHCDLGDGESYPHDIADLGRCLEVMKDVPLTKKMKAGLKEISPLWNDIIDNLSVLEKAVVDKDREYVKTFLNKERSTSPSL